MSDLEKRAQEAIERADEVIQRVDRMRSGIAVPQVPVQTGLPTLRPDFVLAGIAVPGGVMVFASIQLTHAELKRRIEVMDIVNLAHTTRPAYIPVGKATLTCEMHGFTVIMGDDYPSALRTLFEDWERKNAVSRQQLEG